MTATRTAREVVELYNLVVWNERDFALAEQAVNRIIEHWNTFQAIRFDLNLVVAGDDGEHVAIVYQSPMTLKDGSTFELGSMEIFRVVAGKITEVWNCGYKQGVWK
jgi:hypothetical protein